MARNCNVCVHPQLEEIDRLLAAGVPCAAVARDFHLGPDAVESHARRHLPATMVQAHAAKEVARAGDLLEQVRDLHARTLEGLAAAEQSGDLRAMMAAVRETRRNLEFLARLLGQVDERPRVSLLELPEWARLREALFEALRPYPEVRIAVAERLAALGSGGGS